MASIPFADVRQQLLHLLLVANEVVVHDKYGTSPSHVMQLIEFRKYLLGRLGAGAPSVNLDDVAELASEGAAARILDGHRAVIARFDETEVRHGRGRQRRHLVGL